MSSATYDDHAPNAGLLPYRVTQLESYRRESEKWREEVDKERTAAALTLAYLRDDVKTIKRVSITLLIAMVTGSASITLAVLVSTGKV